MAKQNIYCLYDVVDACYTQPFYFARTDGTIARSITAMFHNETKKCEERGVPSPNINEYRLYRLGTFDDETGDLTVDSSKPTIAFNTQE